MRTSTLTKKVSKMDVEIGKMHRELAKLYEERAQLMRNSKSMADIEFDFPEDVIEELVKEVKPAKKAKK